MRGMKLPRFGLRSLLIGITIICVILGAFRVRNRLLEAEYKRQQKLAEQLKEYGAVKWERQTPSWIRWAGDFESITMVDCRHNADVKKALNIIQGVPTITSICLWNDQLKEDVVEMLVAVPCLKTVAVNSHPNSGFAFRDTDSDVKQIFEKVDALRKRLPQISIMNVIQPEFH